ncbi:DEAD/DEAH box helicase [Candidatus Woesearchaeota archaeon]|nr:DEAD/DEAH box helicase [Candidatus Woesearchaeota archaeon]
MHIDKIKNYMPERLFKILSKDITELRPAQEKAIENGLFENKNLLICTPTASGKTLIAELASVKNILENRGKAVYVVPLRALANEKYREFKKKYGKLFRIALSSGDIDSADSYLIDYDFIFTTSEKLDSLIRHHSPWLKYVKTVIIDEIHLLNDPGRGPTLEILITILRKLLPTMQLIALSATIGNPEELAEWLEAALVLDGWRPVKLEEGVYLNGRIEFHER